jgi:hypothetical protein
VLFKVVGPVTPSVLFKVVAPVTPNVLFKVVAPETVRVLDTVLAPNKVISPLEAILKRFVLSVPIFRVVELRVPR